MKRTLKTYKNNDNILTIKNKHLSWIKTKNFDKIIWLDSNDNNSVGIEKNYDFILAIGSVEVLKLYNSNDFFLSFKEFYNKTKDWIIGYISYETNNFLNTNDFIVKKDFLLFPTIYFIQPLKLIYLKDGLLSFCYHSSISNNDIERDYNEIMQCSPKINLKTSIPLDIQSRFSEKEYLNKVHQILHYIQKGDIYEMNFCQQYYANGSINPLDTHIKLNDISAPPFSAYLKLNEVNLICSSPERYISKRKSIIISQPIKGTSARGNDPKEDEYNKNKLKTSAKELSENIMVADLTRNDLSKIATKGSVKALKICEIQSFKQVHHLVSTIQCKSKKNIHPVDILKETFPMASMTGVPKIKAMEIIREIEGIERGVFSGCLGYFSPMGDFDFNVIIRSILYNSNTNNLCYSVGGAITSQSNPKNEYEETQIKAKAIKKILSL